jgi:hypothetical protein
MSWLRALELWGYYHPYLLVWIFVTVSVFTLEAVVIQLWLMRNEAKELALKAWQALPRCERCGAVRVSVTYHAARCKGYKGIKVETRAFRKGENRW